MLSNKFQVLDSGLKQWNLDSGFLELYSGFQSPRFRIQQAKYKIRFPYKILLLKFFCPFYVVESRKQNDGAISPLSCPCLFLKIVAKRPSKFLPLLQSKNDLKVLKCFGIFECHLPNFGSPFVPKTNL